MYPGKNKNPLPSKEIAWQEFYVILISTVALSW
jgi:hypothetical protein